MTKAPLGAFEESTFLSVAVANNQNTGLTVFVADDGDLDGDRKPTICLVDDGRPFNNRVSAAIDHVLERSSVDPTDRSAGVAAFNGFYPCCVHVFSFYILVFGPLNNLFKWLHKSVKMAR